MVPDVQPGVTVYTYSTKEGDFHAENIRIGNGEIFFDFISPLGNIKDIQLGVPVYVNIENGIAAMALAQIGGATPEEIKQAMPGFKGVDRRFDFKLKNDHIAFMSDYAHHPAEIKQSISSVRMLYPDKRLRLFSNLTCTHVLATSTKILQTACHCSTRLSCLTFIQPANNRLRV